jgi:hypothetical protein
MGRMRGGRVGGVEAGGVENERGLSLRGGCGGVAPITPAPRSEGAQGPTGQPRAAVGVRPAMVPGEAHAATTSAFIGSLAQAQRRN